jgi:hypothetical protein
VRTARPSDDERSAKRDHALGSTPSEPRRQEIRTRQARRPASIIHPFAYKFATIPA